MDLPVPARPHACSPSLKKSTGPKPTNTWHSNSMLVTIVVSTSSETRSRASVVRSSWWAVAWSSSFSMSVTQWHLQHSLLSDAVSDKFYLANMCAQFSSCRKVFENDAILPYLQLCGKDHSSLAVKMHQVQIRPSHRRECDCKTCRSLLSWRTDSGRGSIKSYRQTCRWRHA